MSGTKSTKVIILIATLAALLVAADAQQAQNTNQTQNPPAQQTQQAQPAQQAAPAQPQPKKSMWQKLKEAQQAGQSIMQQGTNTVQQGQSTVQQTGQQVQNGVQQIQNAPQQGVNGVQQGMNGAQQAVQGVTGAQPGGTGFQGMGGGGSGSCGPTCFDAGVFQANVSQMTTSDERGWHIIRMNIQFHNSTNQPLVIAYHDGSMVMVDNNGASYVPAGGNPGQLQGMGIDRGNQTDSQFQLAPGQTGYALFSVARYRPATSPIGSNYSYNLTIDELQLQNGALAIPVRSYNLNFPSLAPGTNNASFTPGAAPAPGVVGTGARTTYTGATVPAGTTAAPAATGMAAGGKGQAIGTAAAPQTRMVNGRPVTAPTQTAPPPAANNIATTPAPVVNNAAMRTSVSTTQAKPSVAAPPVKPIPATTQVKPPAPAVKPATAAPPKPAPPANTAAKKPTTSTPTK